MKSEAIVEVKKEVFEEPFFTWDLLPGIYYLCEMTQVH